MSLADYFVRAPKLQTHSDAIIDGFSTVQEAELQRLVHQLQLRNETPGTSTSALDNCPLWIKKKKLHNFKTHLCS